MKKGLLLFLFTLVITATNIRANTKPNEIYELVSIAICLTQHATANQNLVNQNPEYSRIVQEWFGKYQDYVVIKDFDKLLQKDESAYLNLKANSYFYEFGGNNKLVKIRNYKIKSGEKNSDLLAQFIPQLEVFAISSDFRKFYRKNYRLISGNQSQNSFQILNIMDDFWKFWEKAESLDISEKIKLYREMVINPHREIFEGFTGKPTDEELADYFKGVTPLVPKMRKITQKLDKELPEALANFRKNFPDMNWDGTVVFMPNYGSFDSGGGSSGGKAYQIFGVDTIAFQNGENADLSVLFSHELFHLYVGKFQPGLGKNREKGEIPLYLLIWNEGLATYMIGRLNPSSTVEQLFLGQNVEAEIAPKLPRLAKKILDNFENGSPEIWKPFLAASQISDEIPPRSGYYLGYKIAEELGKKMSLPKLAKLNGEKLKTKMKEVLEKLKKENKG